MTIAIHDTIYFDKIERTNKLQTLVAIANASVNIKNKEEVINQLEYALNIFKIPKSDIELGSGTYSGTQKQWSSKYTLSRDFGLVQESKDEIILSEFGLKLANGDISARYFISVVMLNYIQIINNKVVHPMYSIVCEMKSKNVTRLTKEDLRGFSDFNLNGIDGDNYIGGLLDIMQDTHFFVRDDKNTLSINKEFFNIDMLHKIVNIEYLNCNVEEVSGKFSKANQKDWCDYLAKENSLFNKMLIKDYIETEEDINEKKYKKLYKPHNRIIFGAPGTGKSHKIKNDIKENRLERLFKRVTFHPNYTYSQFVGSYKPISKNVIDSGIEKEIISYEFVPGPFLNVLLEALKDEKEGIPHLLVIEEINRANPAAVFGDIFQLLDRDSDGRSSYTVDMSNEMKKYVCEKLEYDMSELYIPSNMYIWSTMNSADQGVYPMDSAFKRRWSFEYIGIDENQEQLKGKEYEFIKLKNEDGDYTEYEWNTVRTTINKKLKDGKVNEDKLLGPFFLSKTELLKSKDDTKEFDNIFKSKILMYLYEDILKHKKIDFFVENVQTLSDIINAYDSGRVFNFEMKSATEVIYKKKENCIGDNLVAEKHTSLESEE